jgi:hypothetical protein
MAIFLHGTVGRNSISAGSVTFRMLLLTSIPVASNTVSVATVAALEPSVNNNVRPSVALTASSWTLDSANYRYVSAPMVFTYTETDTWSVQGSAIIRGGTGAVGNTTGALMGWTDTPLVKSITGNVGFTFQLIQGGRIV